MHSLMRMEIVMSGWLLLVRYVRHEARPIVWLFSVFPCVTSLCRLIGPMDVARACWSINSRQISSSTTPALEWIGLPFALADWFALSRKQKGKISCSEGLRGTSIRPNPFQREPRKLVCKVSYFLPECFLSAFHWTLFAFRVRSLGRTNVTPILTERCSLTSNRREISIRYLQPPIRSDHLAGGVYARFVTCIVVVN